MVRWGGRLRRRCYMSTRHRGAGKQCGVRRASLTPAKRNCIAADQEWKCADCGDLLPAIFHVDHRIPLSEGGTDERDNLAAVCPNCHQIKSFQETTRRFDRER